MKVEILPPSKALKPFIKHFMLIESENGTTNCVLPDTKIVLAFRLRGIVSLNSGENDGIIPTTAITGLQNSHRFITYDRQTATLLAVFQETGASAFFRAPLNEIFGTSLPLECFFNRRKLIETEEKLSRVVGDVRMKISLIENLLLPELNEKSTDPIIDEAVSRIKRTGGEIKIKTLLESLYMSRDSFEKRFRRTIGTSPKHFSRIIRLRNFVSAYKSQLPLTALAQDAGFFDQAHFIRDFKAFTGFAPRKFLRSKSFW